MADELVLYCAVEWDIPDEFDMEGEVADVTSSSAGAPAVGPSPHATLGEAAEGSENVSPLPAARPAPEEGGTLPDELTERRTIFSRWASVVPIDGVPFCHFPSPSGPLQALVLLPAS